MVTVEEEILISYPGGGYVMVMLYDLAGL